MIAARQIAFGGGSAKIYTAKDYVQDGLLYMWDAIENVAWGVRGNPSVDWLDLVNGKKMNVSQCVWGEDCLVIPSVKYLKLGESITIDNTQEATIEIAQLSYDGLTSTINIARGNANSVGYFMCGALGGGGGNWVGNIGTPGAEWYSTYGRRETRRCVVSDSVVYSIADGSKITYVDSRLPLDSVTWAQGTNINNYHPNEQQMLSFRFYSRAITAEVSAHNYSIDKARFGL